MTSHVRASLLVATLLPLGACGGPAETSTGFGGSGGSIASTSSASTGGGGTASTSSSGSSSTSTASTSSSTSASSSSSSGGAPMPKGCVTEVGAGHHVFSCDGGIKYDVEIPVACASGGCGLVLDMHGYTMNAAQEDAGTGMRALGQQHGYVVVQPNAPGLPAGWDQPTHAPLVFAFIGDVAAALLTDPKRAHVMGFSQGGGMTWRMICAHADFFASAAPLAGVIGCEFVPPNAPSREVPTLQIHGHKDNILNFNSFAIPQRDAAIAFWKHGAGAAFEMDATHKATRYLTAAGTPLEFWEHDYSAGSFILGGHCFPGGSDVGTSPFQFGCVETGTFVIGKLAMDFFVAHPMP